MRQELHIQLTQAQQRLRVAEAEDLEHEVRKHQARIDDLIEIAMRHGIDLKPWPEHPLLTHISSEED